MCDEICRCRLQLISTLADLDANRREACVEIAEQELTLTLLTATRFAYRSRREATVPRSSEASSGSSGTPMKLCTYSTQTDRPRAGILVGDSVFDIERSIEHLEGSVEPNRYDSVLSILRVGPDVMSTLRPLEEKLDRERSTDRFLATRLDVSRITLLAPVPRPNSIRDFLAFEEHLVNSTRAVAKRLFPPVSWLDSASRKVLRRSLLRPPEVWYELPLYYKGNPDTVVGPEATIEWPSYSEELDYELEFGIYLWKTGKDLGKSEARDFVAGYTIFNDYSARDIQFREMGGRLGPAKGKDFDTGNVMGPYLVTADEVPDPYGLTMRAYVNDELWSEGSSARMHHGFEDMLVQVSRSETLHPGDFFGSGTVGTGCALELGKRLRKGDRVTLEISKLGRLSNPIGG
jgi:2-keto-4-pentenoate hydratase/2-oxohepta-3-ene-1,7-dioic acid hydratase in catechol pathway